MRKFLQWTTAIASAVLLSACSTNALYKNVKTEETFRRIQDTNPQDLGIHAVSYSYKVTGNAKIDTLSIAMMSGDRLRLTYSKAGKKQFTYIMNGDKSCRLDAAGKNAEALSPAAACSLLYFKWKALFFLLISIVSCVLFEFLYILPSFSSSSRRTVLFLSSARAG